jgi:hypothetical protein
MLTRRSVVFAADFMGAGTGAFSSSTTVQHIESAVVINGRHNLLPQTGNKPNYVVAPMPPPRVPISISAKIESEVEVYVRGRGRGRYVCERCGIRCKKPSMLKKHLK